MEYLDKQKHAELQAEFDKITELLKKHDAPNDLRISLEERKTLLAVMLMNHWLPHTFGRRILMLLILIIGISGFVAGKPALLFLLLLLPFFSPKIVMHISILIGKLKGNY